MTGTDSASEGDSSGGPRSVGLRSDGGGQPERLPLDRMFELLKNSRRRETLYYLKDNDGETSLSDLAEHIAALENDTTVAALSSKQRKRVYVGLYQCHLPMMDDLGVVEFNKDRGIVHLESRAAALDPYLEETDPDGRPWARYYLGASVLGAASFAVLLMLPGVSAKPLVLLETAFFGVTAGANVLSEYEFPVDLALGDPDWSETLTGQ